MGTQENGQVALSKRQPIEMALKSLALGISECSPRSRLGQGQAVCNRIRFLGPVTSQQLPESQPHAWAVSEILGQLRYFCPGSLGLFLHDPKGVHML